MLTGTPANDPMENADFPFNYKISYQFEEEIDKVMSERNSHISPRYALWFNDIGVLTARAEKFFWDIQLPTKLRDGASLIYRPGWFPSYPLFTVYRVPLISIIRKESVWYFVGYDTAVIRPFSRESLIITAPNLPMYS